jgi:hypothetical protein
MALTFMFLLPMADEALRVELRYRHNHRQPEFGRHFFYFHPLIVPTWQQNFPPVPRGVLVQQRSLQGVDVYLGKLDDKGIPLPVFDSPLPAAQYLNPYLELRTPENLQSGFRTSDPDRQGYPFF